LNWIKGLAKLWLEATDAKLRQFGVALGLLALAAGVWRIMHGAGGTVAATLGVMLVVLAYVRPSVYRPIFVPWMAVAQVIGLVLSKVILSALYFAVVTPIGLILRVIGKRPLEKSPDADSYWVYREEGDHHNMDRMF
jgi:hypothetical protein